MLASPSTRQTMLIAGLLQGAILVALHLWISTRGFRPADTLWVAPAYAFAVLAPVTFNFLRGEFSARRSLTGALIAGGVLAAMAFGFGASFGAGAERGEGLMMAKFGSLVLFFISLLIVWFVGLPLLQARLRGHGRTLPYPGLFDDAWRNVLLVANCIAFTLLFWILLSLWAGLFSVIGIEAFARAFSDTYFIYCATALAISFALSLEEKEAAALRTLRRFLLAFQTRLAPLGALIVVLFLAALPVTGIAPLWQTGWSSPLMLCLQIAFIFLVNATWQDGEQAPPFASPVQMLIRVAMALLPVLSVLCIWSLWLRIAQHGWSVDRVWAAVLVGLTTLYAFGYAAVAWMRGWLALLGKVNTAMAFVLIGSLLALYTPVLDPQRIAASSQLSRLISGAVDVEKFDFRYLRNTLGRPGEDALKSLSQLSGHPQAEKIREKALQTLHPEQLSEAGKPTPLSLEALAGKLKMFPAQASIPPGFAAYLHGWLSERKYVDPLQSAESQQIVPLLILDLGGDSTPEVVLMVPSQPVFGFVNRQWRQIGRIDFPGRPTYPADTLELLEASKFAAAPRAWKDVRLGDQTGVLILDAPVPYR